ncbi:hypothetical protein [Yersinia bercovieri]|uniref:hypothetical protein n=1 Tax=Yersinia bercovieri TaxID=634 RepID=UPI0003166A02|nr:hypothetical protein [Yersinia bercovieri]
MADSEARGKMPPTQHGCQPEVSTLVTKAMLDDDTSTVIIRMMNLSRGTSG